MKRDIERVATCGCMVQMCCDTAARREFQLGFQVDFLADATGAVCVEQRWGCLGSRSAPGGDGDDGDEVYEDEGGRRADCGKCY